LSVIQPDQVITRLDLVAFPYWRWNDGLTTFGDGSLHFYASYIGLYKRFIRITSHQQFLIALCFLHTYELTDDTEKTAKFSEFRGFSGSVVQTFLLST
jgi:hypothetical protein